MHDPQFILQLDRDDSPFGYVVVDSLINMTSSGGVRIYPDMALDEARMLAREMTLKFSFIGLRRGGAKCGIRVPSGTSREEKLALCEEFGRRLGPVIQKGLYYPGMDMNCGPDELRAIYRGAGITLGKITDTSFFTALSVANALFAVRDHLDPGRPLTVAIEGFGSVAAYLAERLPEQMFKVVALSTVQGAVRNSKGFCHTALVGLRRQYGDHIVSNLPDAEKIDLGAVLSADVDILVPAARILSLNHENMASVKARCVVPVANTPFTMEAVDFLHSNGVLCLPGFVTNSGGVFASGLYDSGVSMAEIERIGGEHYRPVVSTLIREACTRGVSPVHYAEKIAVRRFERADSSAAPVGLGGKVLRILQAKGVVPRSTTGRQAAQRFVANLRELLAELGS
jgi:glutamate dehydrogenase/leucine dehydrogenase